VNRLFVFATSFIGICSALGEQNNLQADPSTELVAQAMANAAQAFLDQLDDTTRAKALRSFDDPKRVDWHNIPKPVRKGLQLREMTASQKEACHQLLKTALSPTGYEKAVRIMALENNLREGEKNLIGGQLRDPLRYFLTLFGNPGPTGDWGWSFEGHHFSLNFVIRQGQVVAETPSFWGANPATVRILVDGGPEVGVRTLADEEQLALDLMALLSPAQRTRAMIDTRAPAEYRNPGVPEPPRFEPTGLCAADLDVLPKEKLEKLLDTYTGHLAEPIAQRRREEIRREGIDKIYIAWAGATEPGTGHYYRIQGPTFVLELINVQSDPAGNLANHIHSVWRDPRGDFGITNPPSPAKQP
jgi:hypothetical protein